MDYKLIQKNISKSLTNSDIDNFLGHKANIKTYKELKKYDDIDKLLGKYGYCILLYETKFNYGHWCLIFRRDTKNICFFDSYGLKPDDELAFIPPLFKKINGTEIPYLSYLLYYSKYIIEYNEYKFQEMKKGVNTCGRHCLVRLSFNNLDIDKYKNTLDKLKKKYKFDNYDELVTFMTINI